MEKRARVLADRISKILHIPAGLALFLAIILIPKIVAIGMLTYSAVVWVKIRYKDKVDDVDNR